MKARMPEVVLLVVAGLALAQGGAGAQEVRAERFALVDPEGKLRAALGLLDGGPAMWLYDAAWKPRAKLALARSGEPHLDLCDAAGQSRMTLQLIDGGPCLVFRDAAGQERVGLALLDDEPRLRLGDAAGRGRVGLSLLDDTPCLTLGDAAGRERVVLGATETEDARTGATIRHPISTITLCDETGRVQWRAP